MTHKEQQDKELRNWIQGMDREMPNAYFVENVMAQIAQEEALVDRDSFRSRTFLLVLVFACLLFGVGLIFFDLPAPSIEWNLPSWKMDAAVLDTIGLVVVGVFVIFFLQIYFIKKWYNKQFQF
ncbi:MAG: hypothetical protein OIF50_00480 [Flavobacteriaceae bacterium]|nr:hypothetical protein [Flavobacteriaceae bacterium]